MQVCSDQACNMVSSIVKPTKNSCEHSSEMPTRIGSPSTPLTKVVVNSKLAHCTNGNGQATPSPPSSPQRVTRSRTTRSQTHKEHKPTVMNSTTKTEGGNSNDDTSLTHQSNTERLVCPELAISYASTVINSRVGALASRQSTLESQLTGLSVKLKKRQLRLAHGHARKQLDFYKQSKSGGSRKNLSTTFEASTSDMDTSASSSLPIQVDGASDDSLVSAGVKVEYPYVGGESFSSLESSLQDEDGEWGQIGQRLECLRRLVDDEATDCSSDEDIEDSAGNRIKHTREDIKRSWEQTRALVGSKWAWLERRISELNKQICRLDYKIQRRPSRKKFTFSTPSTSPTSYVTLSNGGTLLEQLHRSGGLLGVCKGGRKPGNGIVNHSHLATNQYLPQLLLPGGISGSKLQVKDLLAPSPLGRNLSIFVDEPGDGCARTRPLDKQAKRKVIRKRYKQRRRARKGNVAILDPSHHPQLSLPHEIPSRLLLDGTVQQIMEEHSYAQLLPLSKRRKAASSLAHLSTARPSMSRVESATPSPVTTPLSSTSSISKVVSRRKVYQLTHQSSSLDTPGPMSPPILSRPETPTLTPLPAFRRKRVLTSTPSYDIDNIVIPYSVAASTRLEKLEYKEIITPSWRKIIDGLNAIIKVKVQPERVSPPPIIAHPEAEESPDNEYEDTSDQVFTSRHDKCEQQEKKRFLNFISGGQRKRSRPHSLASTPDPLSASSPLPVSASKRRVFGSPTPSECELFASQYVGVLPWQPRDFPLVDLDLDALLHPPPPPTIIRGPLSPLHTHTPESHLKSRTPSIASTLATPLSSPISTPNEEPPSISPTEWMVVSSQVDDHSNSIVSKPLESCYKPTNDSHIVLKLSKRA